MFPEPYDVSCLSPMPDQLEITFLKPYYFISEEDFTILPSKDDMIMKSIPKQFGSTDEAAVVTGISNTGEQFSLILFLVTIVGQMVGKNLIKQTWPLFCTI